MWRWADDNLSAIKAPPAPQAAADETTDKSQYSGNSPEARSARARHAALVRYGKENPVQARLAKIRQAKAKKGKGGGGKPKADPKAAQAQNMAAVGDALNEQDSPLSKSGLSDLAAFAAGGTLTPDKAKALAALGVVSLGADGSPRLSAGGKRVVTAAQRGDIRGALDAAGAAGERMGVGTAGERTKPDAKPDAPASRFGQGDKPGATPGEDKKKKGGGGGGGGGGKPADAPAAPTADDKAKAKADAAAERDAATLARQTARDKVVDERLRDRDKARQAERDKAQAARDKAKADAESAALDELADDYRAKRKGLSLKDQHRLVKAGRATFDKDGAFTLSATKAWRWADEWDGIKHGHHDQSSHGRKGRAGRAGASAYASARAAGASHQDARTAATAATAAERATMQQEGAQRRTERLTTQAERTRRAAQSGEVTPAQAARLNEKADRLEARARGETVGPKDNGRAGNLPAAPDPGVRAVGSTANGVRVAMETDANGVTTYILPGGGRTTSRSEAQRLANRAGDQEIARVRNVPRPSATPTSTPIDVAAPSAQRGQPWTPGAVQRMRKSENAQFLGFEGPNGNNVSIQVGGGERPTITLYRASGSTETDRPTVQNFNRYLDRMQQLGYQYVSTTPLDPATKSWRWAATKESI